jgi:ppGpp synthetase/RelA/SpoT-type nucleotidyltranferase
MSFVEDEHPRDGDGKFTSKGDGVPEKSTKVSLVKDDITGKYYDKLDKQREEIHGKDWEEFQDIFDKYPQLLKDSGGLPDTSKYNKDMVIELEYQSDEFWKDDEWKKRDEKLKKLEDNPPKSFADLKYEESDKLYDIKDDKDNDKKVDKIRDELRNKKYDNIRPISEWRYVNADNVLRKLEKEYEKTGDSYVKDQINQQKEYLDYHKKDAEVERRIYNHEKLRLENMLSDQENEKQVRIVGINKITDELVMNYHNFMKDKHEKLNQIKHDEKIEKLLKKNWDTIDDDPNTYVAYKMEYGKIIDSYNDYMNKGDSFEPDEGEPTVEEIKTLYNNIPRKVTDFMNSYSDTEKEYENSIRLDTEDVKNDIKYNVVTPLINEGYGISAVTYETRDYLYYPRKEAIESAVEILTKRKNMDHWKAIESKNFQTRLHAGKGPKFTVGNKTHREGGHWSKSANEIKIYNMESYKKLDNILPHEFSHSQFEGIREYVKWNDSNMSVSDLNDNTQEKIKEMYDMFMGEVKNIKEGVESNDLSESIKKLPELEKDLKLESGVFGGGKPEKIFTDYFMDYIRARDDEGVKDRKKAKSVDTEMFACLSELKYSTKPEERKKLFMIKLAYPKLFKSYEIMEGGIKGLPKDEITDKVEVGFNKVDDMRGVMNSVESKKKSYESIEYLNFNGEFVDEENAEVIWIKTYDSDDQLIGMKSYSIDLKEVTEEAYDETKHARGGNAQNTGQFSKGSGGGGTTQTYDTKKLKRTTKHEKPKFPSKPEDNPNVQTSMRFKMIQEVSKHFKNIDTDKLLIEAEKSDNEWQSRENLGLQIDDELAMNFQNSRVMHRTKDTFSSIEKLARKPDRYNTVDDLNDRTGVRVISKDIREVKEAISYIEKNYEIIDEKNYLDNGHPTGSGYRSYHCIIKDKETGFEAEIQVRTENEDVWANVFHDLYKPHEAKMRRALDTNPEGVKKYANDYSNYLYNIDCCQIYGTVPDLPTELAQAGFSYSKEAELDENDFQTGKNCH